MLVGDKKQNVIKILNCIFWGTKQIILKLIIALKGKALNLLSKITTKIRERRIVYAFDSHARYNIGCWYLSVPMFEIYPPV